MIKKKLQYKIFRRTNLFIILIIFVFGGYLLYQLKDFWFGPKISVKNLAEYSAANEEFFEIEGTAKNISEFYLNGRKVFTNENGVFKENLLLAKGINTIQIKAKDKFNHQTVKYYHIIL